MCWTTPRDMEMHPSGKREMQHNTTFAEAEKARGRLFHASGTFIVLSRLRWRSIRCERASGK